MTPEQLVACLACPTARAVRWVDPLNDAMLACGITTPARVAAFIATIGHESGRLRYVRELWGPTPQQQRYEASKRLGNGMPGDGFRYRGRGLIQITGRANYRAVGQALGVAFEAFPGWLEKPAYAALSAAHFWSSHGCNELADTGDFEAICDVVNIGRRTTQRGDANGYAERAALWARAKQVLSMNEEAA